jgi:DNA-binding transcriptional LysR family regulator
MVSLTEEGRAYLISAQGVVDAMAEADSVAEALPTTVRGTLRIHTMPTFARHQVGPWLLEFLEGHPGLSVEIHSGPQFIDMFDQGIDIAIHSGVLSDSSRVARKIAATRWIVCASPKYIENHGTPRTPEELIDHVCLGFSFTSSWNSWAFRCPDGPMFSFEPHGRISAMQGELLRDLALGGGGIVRLADFHIWNDLETGALVPVLEEYQDNTKEPVYVIYSNRRNLSPRIKVFRDYLEERMRAAPWAGLS